jgi:hypothetical protein
MARIASAWPAALQTTTFSFVVKSELHNGARPLGSCAWGAKKEKKINEKFSMADLKAYM